MQENVSSKERAPAARRTPRPRPANRESRAHRLRDGRLVGYAEYGDPDGFPVLAFHGTPGSRIMFRPADAAAAARGLRLIAADRPGYGLSSERTRAGFAPVVEDTASLLDALGIDTFALFGVSGGGPYAAASAAALAERVRALALVSPVGPVAAAELRPLMSWPHRAVFLRLGRSERLRRLAFRLMRLGFERLPRLAITVMRRHAAASDRAILARPEVVRALLEGLNEGLRPGIAGAVRDLGAFSEPWDCDPAVIEAPACLWQGASDATVPPAAAEYLARAIPDCELRLLTGVGHYWIYDHFEDVLSWLSQSCP